MIPYVPEPFIDRSVQYPGRRYITRPDSTVELCQISRSHEGQNAEGAIYAEGTPLNAQSFNAEMTKVKDTLDSIGGDLSGKQDQLSAGSGIVIQGNVISATGGGGGSSTYLSGLADVGLYAPKSGDVLIFDSTQGKWINGDIVTGSGSGAIVSFNDGADGLPLIDLTTAITATQSGTGDPSPSNVRPISGWSAVNVTRTGKNLINWKVSATTFEFLLPSGSYVLSSNGTLATGLWYFRGYDADGNLYTSKDALGLGSAWTHSSSSHWNYAQGSATFAFTVPSGCSKMEIFKQNADGTIDCQIELGSTATSFEQYQGVTVTIALGQTVYGGSLDVTSGVLTITHGIVDLGDLTWQHRPEHGQGVFSSGTLTDYKHTSSVAAMCSFYKYVGIVNTASQVVAKGDKTISLYYNSASLGTSAVYVYDSDYSDATAFTNAVSGQKFVYELAQPVTVQLSGVQVASLLGTNTVWSDAGNITSLKYYRQQAQEIISLIQFDTSIKQWAEDRFAPLYTDVQGTLLAGETYLILNSPKIFTTSTIDIYTDTFGVAPYAIEVQNGNIRLTFVARASDLNVKVRVS